MESELQKLGLTEYETRVYLAALGLGPSNAAQLAKQADIKRPTAYLALEGLMNKGLIFESFINKKRLFKAEKPEKLEKLTKRMRRQVIEAELLLESILPGLVNIPSQYSEEPKVIFYSGLEGMRKILLEVAACKSSWYFFGSSTRILDNLFKIGGREIVKEAIKIRRSMERPKLFAITDSGILSLGGNFHKTVTPWREVKILPAVIKSGSGFLIYEDKFAVLNFENKPFVAVIKSREVVDVVKIMYQLIWKSLG